MIEDSSWSDKHGRLFVKENGRWRPAMLGEYYSGLADMPVIPQPQPVLPDMRVPAEHWRVIAVIAILVAMALAFVLVLS